MTKSNESTPPSVPASARQGGEAERPAEIWLRAERSVWTDRMLEALVNGVKGGKWFTLMDKVYKPKNLEAAWIRVEANRGSAGVDGATVERFGARIMQNLEKLGAELRDGSYRPMPVRRTYIPKPGSTEKRPLGIPSVRDRVAQAALLNVIEPIFEIRFFEHSYGFRPGRSCKDALRRVDALLKAGFVWVVDADIKSYFDTIDHDLLMADVEEQIADGRVLDLLRAYLEQPIFDGLQTLEPERGTPQGAVISPLLANIYLHPVDLAVSGTGLEIIRYADDLVIMCKSEEEAQRALALLENLMSNRKLTLHPTKTRIVDVANDPNGFDFLGYTFHRGRRYPRKKSLKKFRDRIRSMTKRNNGFALEAIIINLNQVIRGWFEFFKHSYKTTFRIQDGWIRGRLRSILRNRLGLKGHGRGADHQRWPIAFFANEGLFTMTTAHAQALRSLRETYQLESRMREIRPSGSEGGAA